MKAQRIQLKRTKGWRMPENTIKVDRSTKWGNPFPDADDPAEAFRQWCLQWKKRQPDQFESWLSPLRGKNLACWCKMLDKSGGGIPCHADILLELANA